ncbi:acyl-CoA thioesterase [Photobacterium sanctipauli]|uniref:Acyl-CoA thioesterase n=1 Tax=Photobacterium sanctipauli TaxID=1342794 RepID=A0A2T3NUC5_9GAMM|nr:acyl-CoA thioesterase [Photobacterium sanctipauli]PSW19896.1 acyl-CoA thioesterase [Photobacterium sanctipauli]
MKDLLDGYPVITQIPVAWGEMDALNHVNNVVYFRYFETARLEYFSHIGMMEELARTQVGPVLSETSCRYKLPITYPDTLHVGSRVVEMQDDRIIMEYAIYSEKLGAISTIGTAKGVMFDFKKNRKAGVSESVKQHIIALQPELAEDLNAVQ